MAIFTGDALRMKLNAVYGMGPMRETLDHAVITRRGNFKSCRHTFRSNRQGVIAGCKKIIVQSAKYAFTGVVNSRQLSVHRLRRTHDPTAVRLPNGLMTKTHAENWV